MQTTNQLDELLRCKIASLQLYRFACLLLAALHFRSYGAGAFIIIHSIIEQQRACRATEETICRKIMNIVRLQRVMSSYLL